MYIIARHSYAVMQGSQMVEFAPATLDPQPTAPPLLISFATKDLEQLFNKTDPEEEQQLFPDRYVAMCTPKSHMRKQFENVHVYENQLINHARRCM